MFLWEQFACTALYDIAGMIILVEKLFVGGERGNELVFEDEVGKEKNWFFNRVRECGESNEKII